jgi:hypothetical protein
LTQHAIQIKLLICWLESFCLTSSFSQLPVSLLAAQYRRLKYLEGVMAGDRDSLRELVQLAERQAQSMIMAQRAQESGIATREEITSTLIAVCQSGTNVYGNRLLHDF